VSCADMTSSLLQLRSGAWWRHLSH
jgi:hypothetical protein